MSNSITTSVVPFSFESSTVRTISENEQIFFHARDILAALGYAASTLEQVGSAIKAIPKEWRTHKPIMGKNVHFISEQGLYFFLGRSDKPKALPFQKWLAGEVLPSIRKTGAYIHTPALRPSITREQCQELKDGIRFLSNNWMRINDQWVYNHLRVAFQVAKFEHIPQDMFPTAKKLIESKKEATIQFIGFVIEARNWFEREVLGAGTPWTPSIQRKMTRQLKRQVILPPKVDWLALEKQTKSSNAKR